MNNELIKGNIKAKTCKPIALEIMEIPFSQWRECECTVYAYFPGGEDKIIAKVRKLDKDNTY